MSAHGTAANKRNTKITHAHLYTFLTNAPSCSQKLNRATKRLILTNCYRALWSNNLDWMQTYFFKGKIVDGKSLSKLLEMHNMLGSHKDTPTTATDANTALDPQEDESEYGEAHRGKQCGHLFKKGESIYRCKNCALDDTCVLCSRCFHATHHEGHDIKIWISRGAGGCCDCADPEAWKVPLECSIHSTQAPASSHSNTTSSVPEPVKHIPAALKESIRGTIEVVLNYILETFATSPEEVSPALKEDIIKDCRDAHSALHIADISHRELPTYSCILWNDEKHSFDDVISVVTDSVYCPRDRSIRVAAKVDSHGRHTVYTSEHLDSVLDVAEKIHSVKLAVTVRSSQATMREDICGLLLEWLKDLISGRYMFFDNVQGGNVILRDIICQLLCEDWALSPELASLSTRSRRGRVNEEDSMHGDGASDVFDDDIGDEFGGLGDQIIEELGGINDEGDFIVTEEFGLGQGREEEILDDEDIEEIFYSEDWEPHDDSHGSESHSSEYSNENGNEVEVEDENEDEDDTDPIDSTDSEDQARPISQFESDIEMMSADLTAANRTPVVRQRTTSMQTRSAAKQKLPKDIVDLDWNIDAWLTLTDKLAEEEKEIAEKMGVPITAKIAPTSKSNEFLKRDLKRKLRLDYLLQFDLRLWKSARANIKDILIGTLISNFDYRRVMGTRFVRNYPGLIDAFFFKDREPEHSASTLSVQMLTVPSVASLLVKEYRFFGIVSSILSGFFLTNCIDIVIPVEMTTMQVDCQTRAMTRHRYACTFFDLRYVLNADPVKIEVCQNPIYLRHFINMIYQFQAMDPLIHQQNVHVEYESNSWTNAFNATLQISKLCRQVADCFASLTTAIKSVEASQNLCRSIYRTLKILHDWDPRLSYEISLDREQRERMLIKGVCKQNFHKVTIPHAGSFEIVDYNVLDEPVSFHHPFHWLLSELFEHVSLLDEDLLKQLGWKKGLKEMVQNAFKDAPRDIFLTILDYPIRTMAVLAQINCGVWVRNGFSVRDLARTYRDISVRENTYDKDIYLLQVGLVATDPNHFLMTMLDRFQITNWFRGKPNKYSPHYDQSSITYIVEEFLNLLIICVTERGYASGETIEEKIRCAIIQHLGISNHAYSELLRLVPDSLSEHESFETQLNLLANYKAPDGMDDHGLFVLKKEFQNEINPYYWHYTRNHREEAFEVLKSKVRDTPSSSPESKEEVLVVPSVKKIASGPFKHLGDFLHSHIFCQIVLYALWNCKLLKDAKTENLLDEALYLAMTAVVDENSAYYDQTSASKSNHDQTSQSMLQGFVQHAAYDSYPIKTSDIELEQSTLLKVLLCCIDSTDMRHIHKRCTFIVEKIELSASDEIKEFISQWRGDNASSIASKVNTVSDSQANYESKKAAAKARQAAIMNQFAQAQSKFMEENSSLYNDDEEEQEQEEPMDTFLSTENINGRVEIERSCHFPSGTCIVCQEALDHTSIYGMLGLVQKSRIQRQTPLKNTEILMDILQTSQGNSPSYSEAEAMASQGTPNIRSFPSDSQIPGLYISTCGHLMHAECFENYQITVNRNPYGLLANHPERFKKRFLCPFCKALGNTLLPIVWKGKKETYPGVMAPQSSYRDILEVVEKTIKDYTSITELSHHIPGAFVDDDESFVNNDGSMTITDINTLAPLYIQLMNTIKLTDAEPTADHIFSDKQLELTSNQLYNMFAYTISAIEISQRGADHSRPKDLTVEHTGTFLDGISGQTQSALRLLAKTIELLPRMMDTRWITKRRHTVKRLALEDLQRLFVIVVEEQHRDNSQSILCSDSFTMLVRLAFATMDSPIEPHHLIRLMYLAELVRTTITLMQGLTSSEQIEDPRIAEFLQQHKQKSYQGEKEAQQFALNIMQVLEVPSLFVEKFFQQISPGVFTALLRTFTIAFLRKCLLLMVLHFGYIFQNFSETTQDNAENTEESEYDSLLKTFRLASFKDTFTLEPFEQSIIKGWCTTYREYSLSVVDPKLKSQTPVYSQLIQLSINLPTQFSMVSLPYRMDQLFDEDLYAICRKCKTLPEYPAMCLVCGTFVCARKVCCTEGDYGECNTHMRSCGGEVGMYMVIKECFILLLHDNGGTVMSAPYLDAHGEADLFLKYF
ncbi:hypothetical protein BDF14DRAFT_1862837 [Spinellus fusiger]|nr:hypothetical protein BDF14DRAFT_1862837 [Spinellus fusiger]